MQHNLSYLLYSHYVHQCIFFWVGSGISLDCHRVQVNIHKIEILNSLTQILAKEMH